MKVTIKDVAKMAGVSVGTVSMVINGKNGIQESTKSKVIETIQQLNYQPNYHARSLITKKSSTIGLIVTNIANPFFGAIVSRMKEVIEQAGYNLLLGISSDEVKTEKKSIENLIGRDVEGLIIVPTRDGEQDLEHLYNLKQYNIPFVSITTHYLGIKSDCVMNDFENGSYKLTSHLLDKGEKEIYFMTDYKKLLLSSKRIEGYKRAFKEKGMAINEEWLIEIAPTYESAYNTTEKLIKEKVPDAILTINDIMAMGVIKCLKDNGIKVPEEVSVAGYDDLLFSSMFEPALTTVKQPIELMCKEAVELLIKRINGEEGEFKTKILPAELIIRESTKK